MAGVIIYVVMTLIAVTPLQVDSQSLTSNNTNGMVCPGQDVEYTCSTGNRLLSWTSPSVLFGINNPNTDIMNLEVTTVSNDSVTISVLIIRYSKTMNATNVTCLPTFTPISLLYYPIHEINSNLSFKVEFINSSSVQAMWTPEETVMTYTVICPLGECNTSFLQQNESSVIFQVRSYSNLNVCLTAGNICNNQVNICTEVLPVSTTPPAPPMTSRITTNSMRTSTAKSVNGNVTTLELRLSSTPTSGSSFPSGSIGGAVGGSVGAVVLCAIVVIVIFFLWKKCFIIVRSSNSIKNGGTEDLEVTTYSTTSHSNIKMNISHGGGVTDVYDQLQHDNTKETFSQYNKPLMYAELQRKEVGKEFVHPLDAAVVYSDIKGTISQVQGVDGMLDLNSLIMQLSPVEHVWKSYGEAIGVPQDILSQINSMEVGNHDKLVEVIDYWLHMHPKNIPPTWKEVCKGLEIIGYNELAEEIVKVYTTGKLPIQADESISLVVQSSVDLPPPLPPKMGVSHLQFSNSQNAMEENVLLRNTVIKTPLNYEEKSPKTSAPPRPPKLKL